jgi:hypothetical protein
MKKLQLAILILVVITLFGLADYFVNVPGGIKNPLPLLPAKTQEKSPDVTDYPNITGQLLDQTDLGKKYSVEKHTRSTELFENFDLSDLSNIGIFKNIIIQTGSTVQLPIYVYEIHGPAGQGSINYLNIKLAMINQLGSAKGINETGGYGYNSLFYNDEKNPTVGFLLSQVGDIVFGFKYAKDSTEAFDFVKSLINNYMSQVTNNS